MQYVDLSRIGSGELVDDLMPQPIHYLGKSEVARFLGMKSMRSLNGTTLPPHDAEIEDRRGWLPETIARWNAQRPGRGRWGKRPKKTEQTGQTGSGQAVSA